MRQTRTRKLSVTMAITRASDPEPPPKATDNSSLADSEVSWSTSQYWASLHKIHHCQRLSGCCRTWVQFVSAVPVNEGRESQRDGSEVPKDLIANTRSVKINLKREETCYCHVVCMDHQCCSTEGLLLCSWSCHWSPEQTCPLSCTRFLPTRWRSPSPGQGWSCAAREHDPAGRMFIKQSHPLLWLKF